MSYGGWSYPPHSILGRLWLVPYEEQAFFVLQPIFIVLLHSLATHSRLLPFDPPAVPNPLKAPNAAEAKVQTLRRRPLVGLFWALVCATGAVFVNEAHGLVDIDVGLGLGMRAFYLGWIFLWASPIIGGLSYLGGRVRTTGDWVTFGISGMWLCFLDSSARISFIGFKLIRADMPSIAERGASHRMSHWVSSYGLTSRSSMLAVYETRVMLRRTENASSSSSRPTLSS